MEFVNLETAFERIYENGRMQSIEGLKKFPNHSSIVVSIASSNEIATTYFIYKGKNIAKAKNCYYEAALGNAYLIEKFGTEPFAIMRHVLYPILSDNATIINRYLTCKPTPEYDKVRPFTIYFGYAVQAALRDDKESLAIYVEGLIKRSKATFVKRYTGSILVFEGLLYNDIDRIKEGLADMVKRGKGDQPAIIRDYMNIDATGLAKLAWRKGFEIDINSPFIPKAILPVHELEHYEGYDFFNDIKM